LEVKQLTVVGYPGLKHVQGFLASSAGVLKQGVSGVNGIVGAILGKIPQFD